MLPSNHSGTGLNARRASLMRFRDTLTNAAVTAIVATAVTAVLAGGAVLLMRSWLRSGKVWCDCWCVSVRFGEGAS